MSVRFLVADIYGRELAELSPDIEAVSWLLNGYGRCKFAISKTDAKATAGNLRFGNRVLLQFSNGLPAWGGIIDTPREWDEKSIHCDAYGGEYLLSYRQTGKARYFTNASVGTIFRTLIEETGAFKPLDLAFGNVWSGGDGHSPEYHYSNLFEIVQKSLCESLSDADFDVTASLQNGRIVLTANLYERKGRDLSNYSLVEGANVTVTRFAEQGQIVNWWDMPGSGSDWSAARPVGHDQDNESIAQYDLRQGSKIYSDVSALATLDTHASTALSESKDPHNMFELTATDRPPARFADYDVGDSLPVILHSVGFGGVDSRIRLIGRSYSPQSNLCSLLVREEL